MRLDDQLAARRLLYPAPMITAPTAMAIDIPAQSAGQGLALGRYYIVILENDDELAEFEAFLTTERTAPGPPDLLDRRPSNRETSAISFFEYAPPAPGWPWILLCHWPAAFAWAGGDDPDAFARGAYTMDAFETREDSRRHCNPTYANSKRTRRCGSFRLCRALPVGREAKTSVRDRSR